MRRDDCRPGKGVDDFPGGGGRPSMSKGQAAGEVRRSARGEKPQLRRGQATSNERIDRKFLPRE
ncbi:MAG: hypothetical protein Ct9H300mP1_16050 [Planctomycetaceae bacterium]|nr:MAG: hypothetical protein Ct9H300mP1_16050 [Planctomycetaceae bacterium]